VLIKKHSSSVSNIERSLVPPTNSVFESNPAVFEFLTAERWDDGTQRKCGTITLFWQEGRWKCWVNDKDSNRSACVTATSVEDLLTTVESGLMSGSLDWRQARPSGTRRGG